jgi:stage V sporulation protein B
LAISISQSIVPIISSAFARNDMNQVKLQAARALRISVISGLPVILFIVIAAGSLNGLLFANDNGTGVIIALTASTFFQILMQTSGAILMGLGRMRVLLNHVFVGVLVKIAAVYAFASWLGVYGFVASTALCFSVMTLLNLRVLRRVTGVRMFTLKSWQRLVVSTAIICVCGSLIESFGERHITWFFARINHLLTAALVGIVVLGLYCGLLLLTRIITKEDIAAFPAPIRRLMGRLGAKIAAK